MNANASAKMAHSENSRFRPSSSPRTAATAPSGDTRRIVCPGGSPGKTTIVRSPGIRLMLRPSRLDHMRTGPVLLRAVGWLGDSRALAVLSFDVDAESPILAQGRHYADHAMVMTHQAYGPLVGVPRLLELLGEYGLPATFFVPGLTADRYPAVVERIAEAGHEIGHHSYSHLSAVDLSEQDERADFERALAALERVGVRPAGHRAAMWEASWRTPGLVAEYGLRYDSSLMDADTPY